MKRMRQEEHDVDMGELVEYGIDDVKSIATTKVHIIRRGPEGTAHEEEG